MSLLNIIKCVYKYELYLYIIVFPTSQLPTVDFNANYVYNITKKGGGILI